MLIQNQTKNGKLLIGGIVLIALRSILQPLIDRTSRSNDVTDFALGLLLGVGLGLIGLFVFRLGRGDTGAKPVT